MLWKHFSNILHQTIKMFDEWFVNIVGVSPSLTNYAHNIVINSYQYYLLVR